MAVSPSDWCNDVGAGTGETEESWSFQVMTGLESSAKKKEVSQKLIWEVREAVKVLFISTPKLATFLLWRMSCLLRRLKFYGQMSL
jgi:hypothetical protein